MLIELSHITRYYQTGGPETRRHVLDDISFAVNPGDSIAITGPSGSGKSTLLNLMGTLDSPDSGKVRFKGQDISELNERELATIRNEKIGFVFQLHYLLPQLTLYENIQLPLLARKDKTGIMNSMEKSREVLKIVGLSDKLNQFPGQLSVGESQRAAVVRALITEPELLLADEPTGSLDQASAAQLADLFLEIHTLYKTSIVMVTHSVELAKRMKTQYVLSNGKLVSD